MDFLEGSLLGPLWSDTDYATRKHRGTNLLVSFIFWLYLAYAFYKINTAGTPYLLRQAAPNWTLLALFLFLISPFLCLIYYRTPVVARLGILFLQFSKYLMMYLAVFKWLAPNLEINLRSTITSLTIFLNDTIGTSIEYYTERYHTSGLFVSATILGVLICLIGLAILAAIVALPFLYLALLRWFQAVLDDILWIMIDVVNYFTKKDSSKVPTVVKEMAKHAEVIKDRDLAERQQKAANKRLKKQNQATNSSTKSKKVKRASN